MSNDRALPGSMAMANAKAQGKVLDFSFCHKLQPSAGAESGGRALPDGMAMSNTKAQGKVLDSGFHHSPHTTFDRGCII